MDSAPEWVRWLPTLNACLNTTSAILLVFGYRFIRARRIEAHRACMVAALTVSMLFLASYLTLHFHVGATRFGHEGELVRGVYLTILLSHTVLAIAVAPMVIVTVYRAARGRFADHARIARWTFPVWLYVSVTGVLVYVMLYHLPGAGG